MERYEYDCDKCLKSDVCKYKEQYISVVDQVGLQHISIKRDDPNAERSTIRLCDISSIEQPIRIHCKFRFEKPVIKFDATSAPTNIYHVSEQTPSSIANFDSKPLFGGLTDDRK